MISAEEFKRQPLPIQLQTLATSLAHISTTSHLSEPPEKFEPTFTESMYYIEWVAPHLEPKQNSPRFALFANQKMVRPGFGFFGIV